MSIVSIFGFAAMFASAGAQRLVIVSLRLRRRRPKSSPLMADEGGSATDGASPKDVSAPLNIESKSFSLIAIVNIILLHCPIGAKGW